MLHDLDHQANIFKILKNLRGIEPLRELFWTELNYDRYNDENSRAETGRTQLKTPSSKIRFFLRRAE